MRWVWGALALSFTSFALASKAAEVRYSIGCYNIENLWDADADNTPKFWQHYVSRLAPAARNTVRAIEYEAFSASHSNYFEPEVIAAKVNNVVTAIRLANAPDILGLQEIESAGNASQVWSMQGLAGKTLREELAALGYVTFLIGEQHPDNPVSVTPGMIAKVPLTALAPIHLPSPTPNASARDIMVAEWRLPHGRVLLINGHLKSKRDGGEALRLAQTRAIRQRIEDERVANPASQFIVMGDLNSAYLDAPLQVLGTTGDRTSLLAPAGSPLLYNLWYQLPEDERWENSFGGVKNTLSHILLSHEFFNEFGLSYLEGSFQVVGHAGPAAKVLLSPSGVPFNWQTMRLDAHHYRHVGQGFSDHLPLVAQFSYTAPPPGESQRKKRLGDLSGYEKSAMGGTVLFDQLDVCHEEEALDFESVDWEQPDAVYGQCVKITSEPGMRLQTTGIYRSNAVALPEGPLRQLVITMTRAYDWRPNIDDSRIDYHLAALAEGGRYSPQRPHPQSNQCYVRKVLQGPGGRLHKALGRVAYVNGYLSLAVASREAAHLELSDLPEKKMAACPWDGAH